MIRTYLDSNVLIYMLDSTGPMQVRAAARLAGLGASGATAVVSWLVRLECRVGPLKRGDTRTAADFDAWFATPSLVWAPMSEAVFDRAAAIAAVHRFKIQDSLHLASAVEAGCRVFLTNDAALARFRGLFVDVLT